jgi:hypothetical protein
MFIRRFRLLNASGIVQSLLWMEEAAELQWALWCTPAHC